MIRLLMLMPLLLLTDSQCGPKQAVSSIDATAQMWFGGAIGTHGTYYRIYFREKDVRHITFDSLWVAGRRISASLLWEEAGADSAIVFANDYRGIRQLPGSDAAEADEAPFPIAVQAAAVLGAVADGRRVYIPVPAFRKLPNLYYP